MTPEERQLLTTLADRVKSTPAQSHDLEADQLLRQLVQERPDTVYILAQTVLMQDFALRNAQSQIDDLKRQLSQMQEPAPAERGSGSFLGGLFGGGSREPGYQPSSGSVPRVNPWGAAPQGRPSDEPPPPPPGYQGPGYPGQYGGPVMQPSQTGGFLRSAAQTAAGVAGGALLFQGINSLFSGHSGMLGGGLGGLTPRNSLSETAVVHDSSGQQGQDHAQGAHDNPGGSGDDGYTDADYDSGYDDGGYDDSDYS